MNTPPPTVKYVNWSASSQDLYCKDREQFGRATTEEDCKMTTGAKKTASGHACCRKTLAKHCCFVADIAIKMLCFGLLINRSYVCVSRYLNGGTRLLIEQVPTSSPDAKFVALTVCPAYHAAYKVMLWPVMD